MKSPAIGELIKRELSRQERTVVWFANRLSCDRTNVYRIFAKRSLDTELLVRISIVLGHNFFADIASELDNDLSNK
ncbi:MAG: XRE family transcriptional regulator [Alistipes sp.]|nr:XRE family transcriptional regulator [Alistipes sp.]